MSVLAIFAFSTLAVTILNGVFIAFAGERTSAAINRLDSLTCMLGPVLLASLLVISGSAAVRLASLFCLALSILLFVMRDGFDNIGHLTNGRVTYRPDHEF